MPRLEGVPSPGLPFLDEFDLDEEASMKGYLNKLVSRKWFTLWSTHINSKASWRTTYCMLRANKLYYYQNQLGLGIDKKNCGQINLDYYDVCEPLDKGEKGPKYAFLIYSSLATSPSSTNSAQSRHIFSADSAFEMFKWISSIQNAIKDARTNRKGPNRRRQEKLNKSKEAKHKTSPLESTPPFDASTEPTEILHCETKNRPKGPTGRRLPGRKSLHSTIMNGVSTGNLYSHDGDLETINETTSGLESSTELFKSFDFSDCRLSQQSSDLQQNNTSSECINIVEKKSTPINKITSNRLNGFRCGNDDESESTTANNHVNHNNLSLPTITTTTTNCVSTKEDKIESINLKKQLNAILSQNSNNNQHQQKSVPSSPVVLCDPDNGKVITIDRSKLVRLIKWLTPILSSGDLVSNGDSLKIGMKDLRDKLKLIEKEVDSLKDTKKQSKQNVVKIEQLSAKLTDMLTDCLKFDESLGSYAENIGNLVDQLSSLLNDTASTNITSSPSTSPRLVKANFNKMPTALINSATFNSLQ